jgi:hypothetical protein
MPLATCLFNSKSNECIILQDIGMLTRKEKLKLTEKQYNWDIANHDIFIAQLTEIYAKFKIIQAYSVDSGGLITHELQGCVG